jgi:molybdenum-dependent DNA-binding transcriptional regulator ModE
MPHQLPKAHCWPYQPAALLLGRDTNATPAHAWLQMRAGGSRGAGGSLLLKLHELLEAEDRLAGHQARLAQIEQQLRQLEPLGRQYRKYV